MFRGFGSLLAVWACCCTSVASAGTLTIESWRVDDKATWDEVLIPAFNKLHPDIKLKFIPTSSPEYNSALNARLAAGSAGDLITCRPFDPALDLFKKGYLEPLGNQNGLGNFTDAAKGAWQTDDGAVTYCMPMASVIHGFFYNKRIFTDLGLSVPTTEATFFAILDKIKAAGKVAPLALGTADQWEASQVVFTSIGPNRWHGEEGRKGLIAGRKKFTDPEFVATWETMVKLAGYLSKGYQSQSYSDSKSLFEVGRAAIYPAGSWEISYLSGTNSLDFGVFRPPVQKAGDTCYISDHTDMGMGINSKSANKADAQVFLSWLASKEFANLYANKLVGFFPLSKHSIEVQNPVAKEMLSWRTQCKSTIRLTSHILNRGVPDMEHELWNVNARVLNLQISPTDAARQIQVGLAKWYSPSK